MKATRFRLINSFCFLLLLPTAAFAQTSNDPSVAGDTSFLLKGYLNQLQFTPLKLLGWLNPGIELGFERMDKSRWSSQLTATYLLPYTLLEKRPPAPYGGKSGFKIAAEEKFYVRKMARKGFYVAAEVAYLYSRNTTAMSFESITLARPYSDTFEITKNNLYFSLKCGYYFTLKRIMVSFSGGLGAQCRNAQHSGRIQPEDQFAGPFPHFTLAPTYNRDGRSWEPYFPLTIRIGYLF